MNDGDTHNGPSEQVEAKYPLLVERYCLRPDSGGAGTLPRRARHRAGGAGAPSDPLQLADGARALQAVGTVRRPVRLRQRGRGASLRQDRRDAFPERQGAQPGAAGRATPTSCAPAAAAATARRWSATSTRSSATCAAATSPRRPRRNTTARCSSRIRWRSTWRRPQARRASMAQQGLPHDEPITEIIIPFPTAAAAADPRARAREADRRRARGVRDAVPLLLVKGSRRH